MPATPADVVPQNLPACCCSTLGTLDSHSGSTPGACNPHRRLSVLLADPSRESRMSNQATLQITGLEPPDVLGKHAAPAYIAKAERRV